MTATPKHLLSVAAFCMRVLDEGDGLMSGIRFVDHLTFVLPPNHGPEDRVPVSVWAFVAFKARSIMPGEFTGEHALKLALESHGGTKKIVGTFPITATAAATSLNYRIKLDLGIKTQGVWWGEVSLDDEYYTRMPLRIIFEKTPAQGAKES